jgi:hypothetical protein
MQEIKLEIPYYNTSSQGLMFDLSTYAEAEGIKVKVEVSKTFESELLGKGSFGRITFNNKKILFDLQDNPSPYDFYCDYDVIFKRSYSNFIGYEENVFPYGLRVDLFYNYKAAFKSNLFHFIFDRRGFKELTRTFFNCLGKDFHGYNNLKRSWSFLSGFSESNKEEKQKKIVFSTRLWYGNAKGEDISAEREKIYNLLKSRNDVILNQLTQINQSDYFKKLKDSNIVIINNGLHNVPGFRLGELLIMGKVVITTPTNIKIPGLVNGVHYIECEIDQIGEILDTLSLVKLNFIKENARKYAIEFLGPSMRLKYFIDKINLSNI